MKHSTRMHLLPCALIFQLSAVLTANAEPYIVEGFTLGSQISPRNSNYRLYACDDSKQFNDFIWCQRRESRQTSVGSGEFTSTIMHDKNRNAVYLMANLAPVSLTKAGAQREIDDISRETKQSPKTIQWFPQRGAPSSVIALWGNIEVDKLDSYELEAVSRGESPKRGLLVDTLGDLARSAQTDDLPVYRITGGAGYVFAASFDSRGRGHLHYVAADMSVPAIKKFEPQLRAIVEKDQSLARDDYRLWPRIADKTRSLALDSSPEIANRVLDKLFENKRSQKLRSHVWSVLPLSAQHYLAAGIHSTDAAFGPDTEHPKIRLRMQAFLRERPAEPFADFLYYSVGEFDKAVKANPNSVAKALINYAAGYSILESLLRDLRKALKLNDPNFEPINSTLIGLNQNPTIYGDKLLGSLVPDFSARATAAKPYFEAVLSVESSPLRDDAAYMLGWLALHQGKFDEAFDYTGKALTLRRPQKVSSSTEDVKAICDDDDYCAYTLSLGDDTDYEDAAERQLARIFAHFPLNRQEALIQQNAILAKDSAQWWQVAVRSAYRDLNHSLTVEIGEKALQKMNIPLNQLPVTTNSVRISEALDKLTIDGFDKKNVNDIVYLIEASREILDYQKYLKTSLANDRPDNVTKRAKGIVLKYSLLIDDAEKGAQHKDLRQAAYLIEMTLERVPQTAPHAKLREWLYYRNARNLAEFNPKAVPKTVAMMERQYPQSSLVDDALAEQVYAEGARLGDVDAAEKTFRRILRNYPNGNAVDNAYTWMAISYECAKRKDDAKRINQEIVQRFPATRHATYARERLAGSEHAPCGVSVFSVDRVYLRHLKP